MVALTAQPHVVVTLAPRTGASRAPRSGAGAPAAAPHGHGARRDADEGASLLRSARKKRGSATTCQSYRKGKNGKKECADGADAVRKKGSKGKKQARTTR